MWLPREPLKSGLFEPITFLEWAEIMILAVPLLIVMEIFKLLNTRGPVVFERFLKLYRPCEI